MSDRYRLESLRSLRGHVESDYRARLAEIRREFARALAEREQARIRAQKLRERRREAAAEPVGKAASAAALVRAERYRLRLHRLGVTARARLNAAEEQTARCERDLNHIQDALGAAHLARKAVDRHRQRWSDERRRGRSHRDQAELDDLGGGRKQR